MNILGWRICHRVRVVNFFVLQMVGEQIAFSFHSCLESIIWDDFGVGGGQAGGQKKDVGRADGQAGGRTDGGPPVFRYWEKCWDSWKILVFCCMG